MHAISSEGEVLVSMIAELSPIRTEQEYSILCEDSYAKTLIGVILDGY